MGTDRINKDIYSVDSDNQSVSLFFMPRYNICYVKWNFNAWRYAVKQWSTVPYSYNFKTRKLRKKIFYSFLDIPKLIWEQKLDLNLSWSEAIFVFLPHNANIPKFCHRNTVITGCWLITWRVLHDIWSTCTILLF